MSEPDSRGATLPPWRFFDVTVGAIRRLSPTFARMTVTGPDLDRFADLGLDARVKVVLPDPSGGYVHLPREGDWYPRWRQLPKAARNPLRTYTTRCVRPDRAEVDIDIVLHGQGDGAATSGWVHRTEVGQALVLLGPDAESTRPHGGVEFVAPGPDERLILVGDETAVPAIANIVGLLPAQTSGEVWLEVPDERDVDMVDASQQLAVSWMVRGDRPHGERLLGALREHSARGPTVTPRGAPPAARAWVAGEAGLVRSVRRHLIQDRGVARSDITFMGYWKRGCVGG